MNRRRIDPAEGERRALIGYVPQYRLCAEIAYAALIKGQLRWIALLNSDAGHIDDFLIGGTARVDAYQLKHGEEAESYTLNSLFARAKGDNGTLRKSLLEQLYDGWKRLAAANPRETVDVHLVLRGIPTTIGAVPNLPEPLTKESFQQFLREFWESRTQVQPNSKWHAVADAIRTFCTIPEDEYQAFRAHCHFDFFPKVEPIALHPSAIDLDRENDIEQLKGQHAVEGTVLYSPEVAPGEVSRNPGSTTRISVANETAFMAMSRLAQEGDGHVACLNFASAKNPGGGFLSGAQAQEEALARASALYPCLLSQPSYYDRHRANRSALYLDLVIFSPKVPFFRDDSGQLLDEPLLISILTVAAPNAGAVAANEPRAMALVEPTLRRRAELVLAVAAAHRVDKLVLGAWGCGVFRNDPRFVAQTFADLLQSGFRGQFKEVLFAVYDTSSLQNTYRAFADCFNG